MGDHTHEYQDELPDKDQVTLRPEYTTLIRFTYSVLASSACKGITVFTGG
jgi:hypothetical protein